MQQLFYNVLSFSLHYFCNIAFYMRLFFLYVFLNTYDKVLFYVQSVFVFFALFPLYVLSNIVPFLICFPLLLVHILLYVLLVFLPCVLRNIVANSLYFHIFGYNTYFFLYVLFRHTGHFFMYLSPFIKIGLSIIMKGLCCVYFICIRTANRLVFLGLLEIHLKNLRLVLLLVLLLLFHNMLLVFHR